MRIALGSDHAGFALKEFLKRALAGGGMGVEDLGTHSAEAADYPDYGAAVAGAVAAGRADLGILVCHTGIGMSITANKVPGIRAALCGSEETARLARSHNHANVLALAGSFTPPDLAERIVRAFLETPFEGGRHDRRVSKIHELTGR